MKVLSSCALFGATRALSGIKDALVMQHSVVGCQWGTLSFRYRNHPYGICQASTVIYDDDIIRGGERQLRNALKEAVKLYKNCKMIFVISGCVPNMIGDDVDGLLWEIKEEFAEKTGGSEELLNVKCSEDMEKTESKETEKTGGSEASDSASAGRFSGRTFPKLLHIKTPGYQGNVDSGIEDAYLALLPLMERSKNEVLSNGILSKDILSKGVLSNGILSNGVLSKGVLSNDILSKGADESKKVKKVKKVNILGLLYDDCYAENDFREIKQALGGKVEINCSLHNCTPEDITRMPEADCNIVFSYGIKLAKKMQKKFGTDFLNMKYPYGIAGMQDFLQIVGEKLGVDFSEEIAALDAEGEKIVAGCAEYLVNLHHLSAAVVADKAHLGGMTAFLADELGMQPAVIADTAETDMDSVEKACMREDVTLLCGSSWNARMAAEHRLPFLRFVYPVFDRVAFSDKCFLGVRGLRFLLEDIINAALSVPYKEEGLYSSLYALAENKASESGGGL